jgi:penicillin amidase
MRRRLVLRSLAGLVVLLAIGGAGIYWYLRQSLPATDGTVTVRGLAAPVDIVRDADGIPHIRGSSKPDAFFGLGYVHAQDRLWQMEFQRRIGHGRLSEIFGSAALPQDRFLRTVGFGRAARSAWELLPDDVRRDIDAYVAGVNAFLARHHGRELPPEFSLLRFEPEPWSGPDVLAWVKMMAWDLSANYSSELFRYDLTARLGAEKAAALLPPYPEDGITIVKTAGGPAAAADAGPVASRAHFAPQSPPRAAGSGAPPNAASVSAAFADAMAGLPAVREFLIGGARTEALGSNSWVVDGTLTASGKPLLANDPHLGTHIPSLWYLAHMTAGDFEVIGATLPGAPAVAIGRNRHIAWGETNVGADVQDLYREKLDAAGRSAEFRGHFEPLRIVREEIAVKGGEPVVVDVRISRHGPLVSDAINANNAAAAGGAPARPPLEPLAFRWTALDEEDTTIAAFLKLNTARDWAGFQAAMRDFVTPSQNFVYADVDGHIGYFAPGRIPIRASGDGTAPAIGWSGEQEWIGWIPFGQLPQLFDPPDHLIVTANHRPNPRTDPQNIAVEYPEPYRAERIAALLANRKGLRSDDFQRMQADTHSLHAQSLLPVLLRHVDAVDDNDRQALALLRTWDYDAARDSAAAAVFQVWFLQLGPAIAGDDLGPQLLDNYQGRYSFITRFLLATLGEDRQAWCDNTATPVAETCRQAVTTAFRQAVGIVKARLGNDPRAWKWGNLHPAVFPHQGLDAVAVLRPILNRSIANGGDWSTVNVGAVAADHQFEQRAIPGYRHIVDLSPANDSRFQDAVGQSGHFLSSRYDDFIESWQAVRHRPMRMERADIERGATGWLKLMPAPPAR